MRRELAEWVEQALDFRQVGSKTDSDETGRAFVTNVMSIRRKPCGSAAQAGRQQGYSGYRVEGMLKREGWEVTARGRYTEEGLIMRKPQL